MSGILIYTPPSTRLFFGYFLQNSSVKEYHPWMGSSYWSKIKHQPWLVPLGHWFHNCVKDWSGFGGCLGRALLLFPCPVLSWRLKSVITWISSLTKELKGW